MNKRKINRKGNLNANFQWLRALVKRNMKIALAYKSSFLIQVIGMFLNNLSFLIVWYFVFRKFGDINGWTFKEMFGLQGVVALAYGFSIALTYGIRNISKNITYGQVDKFMVLPKNVLLSMIFSEVQISAFGDIFEGGVNILIYFIITGFSFEKFIIAIVVIILATLLWAGYLIITQSLAFWLSNSEELSNSLLNATLGAALYPNKIFEGIPKVLFTFVFPSIFMSSMPVDIIKDIDLSKLLLLTFFAAFWLLGGIVLFNQGLKRYESGNLVGTV